MLQKMCKSFVNLPPQMSACINGMFATTHATRQHAEESVTMQLVVVVVVVAVFGRQLHFA